MHQELPSELITEILLRLPVKPLLRFKCVSKWFFALIGSPDFAKMHLHRSFQTNTRLSLIRCVRGQPLDCLTVGIFAAEFDAGLAEAVKLTNPLFSLDSKTFIYGSCRGLLLLKAKPALAIWNPFTRRYKKLPTCPLDSEIPKNYWSDCDFGLGYDSASDDYKVVRVSEIISRETSVILSVQVWVFSLRSNCWRRIEGTSLGEDGFMLVDHLGCFANGVLYWLWFRRGKDLEGKVVGFDLADEKFYDVARAPVIDGHLEIVNGRLCLTSVHKTSDLRLYVSKEDDADGGGVSWIELYTISLEDLNVESTKFMAYSKDGEKALFDDGFDCVWYDFEKKSGELVDIRGMPDGYESSESYVCWESLVSLGDDSKFDGAN